MHLSELSLTQFKNYQQASFRFNPNLNILFGLNGAGKTNVLDAIYYLSITKSYFNSVDHQQILQGNHFFVIEGQLNLETVTQKLRLIFQKGIGKSLLINNNEVEKFSSHIGAMPLVMIAPGDIQLIYEGSEERRKFMDLIISQCDRVYLHELMQYQRAIDQRNKLLKDFFENRYFNRELLEVYNTQLGSSGSYVHRARVSFIELFKPFFIENYQKLAGKDEGANLVYDSDLNKQFYPDILIASESADIDLLRTTRGIHRDDIQFLLDDNPLKKFGSQGQQKSFIIALKLAQFQYLHLKKGIKPLLLLDDIFEKLDHSRLTHLFNLVSEGVFGQIFITDTQHQRADELVQATGLPATFFHIQEADVLPFETNPSLR
ncbi:MAG: DNA replication and repair protein RecF [Bacteroidetes bacterium B1(2017)]|nr:MAG: DNA replication and repair protein RecF [Bacteroidetes bacterium B1(2017)]